MTAREHAEAASKALQHTYTSPAGNAVSDPKIELAQAHALTAIALQQTKPMSYADKVLETARRSREVT